MHGAGADIGLLTALDDAVMEPKLRQKYALGLQKLRLLFEPNPSDPALKLVGSASLATGAPLR